MYHYYCYYYSEFLYRIYISVLNKYVIFNININMCPKYLVPYKNIPIYTFHKLSDSFSREWMNGRMKEVFEESEFLSK